MNAEALAKKLPIPAESGSRNVLPGRLFQTAALAKVNVCPMATVAVPALLTVRPSIFEKNPPARVAVPFRFVTPVPVMIPWVQVRSPDTVTVPGPVIVPNVLVMARD